MTPTLIFLTISIALNVMACNRDTSQQITLAGGCFWGTEHYLKQLPGIIDTEVGYVNSNIPNPTYEQVCHGVSEAAEGVQVTYDPAVIDLDFILQMYFRSIDPTSIDCQGNDRGAQYRTGIYYTTDAQRDTALAAIAKLQLSYRRPIAIEVLPLTNFYPAEDYHQDYLDKNPTGYCHIPPQLIELARNARPTHQK